MVDHMIKSGKLFDTEGGFQSPMYLRVTKRIVEYPNNRTMRCWFEFFVQDKRVTEDEGGNQVETTFDRVMSKGWETIDFDSTHALIQAVQAAGLIDSDLFLEDAIEAALPYMLIEYQKANTRNGSTPFNIAVDDWSVA